MCGRRRLGKNFLTCCSIGRVRSCVRPVCAAVKPLAIMLCAGRVPIRSSHSRCADPSGFSRSPDRPCLHYVVMSSPIPLKLQTPSSLPSLTSFNRSGFDANQSIALRCRRVGAVHCIRSGHHPFTQQCPLYPRKRHSIDGRACLLGPLSRMKWRLQSQKARHNCDTRPESKISYNRGMNENLSRELFAWLTQAGLAGTPESDIFSVFCDRCVAAGIPLGRAHVAIDTLHPVHEGSLFRWGYPNEPLVYEYGRTSLEGLDASGAASLDAQATDVWRRGPFYNMLQTGASLLRRRLNADTKDEFSMLADWLAAGMTDYVAITTRFAAEGVIGEMDAVYSSWGTKAPEGFNDSQIATLEHLVPHLALAIKSVSLARMTRTLMETYLGRDAGQRVLSGRIVRGLADRIDAVVWFSDLRGFTRITDTTPEQMIPLLNDYSDVIVSAIHEHGGDVLKLIGDGTLAIFTAENRTHACDAALSAAIAAPRVLPN